MGFLQPSPPPVDMDEWERLPHLERIKPLAQDWALNGFGTPYAVYLLYVVKLVVYSVGAAWVIGATTPGLGGITEIGNWWTQPIVFQKLVVWTMLWEVIGLGAGSMPLTFRFSPMIGGILYWLRPGTVRQPPWPEKVPLTKGTTRTPVDALLYAGLLASLVYLLVAGDSGSPTRLDPPAVGVALAFLGVLGLRDKLPFLAARSEVYGTLLVICLFPLENLIVAAQITFVCIWWGAASSKLNRHFPFVVSVMISNTPWNRSRLAKSRLYTAHPEDLRPSRVGALTAHMGTVIEFTLPLLLLLTSGGTLGTIALVGMIVFHVHITSTFPLAVPLEWNLFMIFGLLFLFGQYGDVPLSSLDDPLLMAFLAVVLVGLPVLGNLRPDLVSFLPSMRYYAGNWAASQWLFRKDTDAEERLDSAIAKPAPVVVEQLTKFYGRELAELLLYKGLAFRSMHTHGRALNALTARAVDDLDQYRVREGELIAGVVCGYNFGDGHFHDHRLLTAVQERCRFAPGELRVVCLESQPAHKSTQRYRILDAAEGVVEEGEVDVRDMVTRQPWLGDDPFPVRADAPSAVPVP